MWFWYALISALLSSVSVIFNKKALNKINASLVSWSLFAISIPILVYPAFKNGIPKLNLMFWLATVGSVVFFGYAKTLALKSLKGGLMSEIIPLAFFAVFFQYIFGLIFLGEIIKPISILGLILVVFGGYFLKVEEAREDLLRPFKLLITERNASLYLFATILMVFSSVLDKTSLLNMKPANQSFYLLLGNIMLTIIIGSYLFKKNKKWTKELKDNFWILLVGGVAYTLLSLSYLYGITTGSLALVSGVKKLEVFFALLFSWILFNDKPKKNVWIGCLIMLIGVIFIKIG